MDGWGKGERQKRPGVGKRLGSPVSEKARPSFQAFPLASFSAVVQLKDQKVISDGHTSPAKQILLALRAVGKLSQN